MLPLSELFTALTDLFHLRHPVLAKLRSYLTKKGISEEVVGVSWAFHPAEPRERVAELGPDPRVSRPDAFLSLLAASSAAPRGVAAVVRREPGAE